MTKKEKPLSMCPFCGTKPITKHFKTFNGGLNYSVQCSKCSGNTRKPTKYEAIEEWNRRTKIEI